MFDTGTATPFMGLYSGPQAGPAKTGTHCAYPICRALFAGQKTTPDPGTQTYSGNRNSVYLFLNSLLVLFLKHKDKINIVVFYCFGIRLFGNVLAKTGRTNSCTTGLTNHALQQCVLGFFHCVFVCSPAYKQVQCGQNQFLQTPECRYCV